MKLKILLIIAISLIFIISCIKPIVCPMDVKICPDGTGISRDTYNNCQFKECPNLTFCNQNIKENERWANPCPNEMTCYKFEDQELPYCYQGDPCFKCNPDQECNILESIPIQIKCI